MCGIVAVVRQPSRRPLPDAAEVLARLDTCAVVLGAWRTDAATALTGTAGHLEEVDLLLRGVPGVRALLDGGALPGDVRHRVEAVEAELGEVERRLDAGELRVDDLEKVNAALVRARDAAWAVLHDRVRTALAVADLCGDGRSPGAVEAFTSIQVALSALDRLEVRGRDSAGLHVLVESPGVALDAADVRAAVEQRRDPLFTSGAVRTPEGHLCFVYKAAAEIGELGDNCRVLREAIRADDLLHRALSGEGARATVLGHTRWASVGIVSEANAHPLNQEEAGRDAGGYAAAALNGDVDNFAALVREHQLALPAEITTDAKVIPVLLGRGLEAGGAVDEAFVATVRSLHGSVAVAATTGAAPRQVHLALRGSGQALYVGLAEDAFVVASEPYGLVEETSRYLRMDGETPGGADGTRGQVVVLDGDRAGSLEGVRRLAYDGTALPVGDGDLNVAEITTRDIDRKGAPHFLLKEITESPASMRKTLRGKVAERDGLLAAVLPDEALPPSVRTRLAGGDIRHIVVIGQGTAAVAGRGVASAIEQAIAGSGIWVGAETATELSGFGLRDEMTDTLVVAISQSGTTTDTNRTVDLVRARGASVLAIVNRRNSDLVQKADGVLYTSDGRDVEMAVPSTKAFYAQVTAGVLLSLALADAVGTGDRHRADDLLGALRRLPDAMEVVLERRPQLADVAGRHAPPRRHWAVVGNGRNRVAAEEVRIKLSELCYKSIACDATEDKKHIDLAAEPLILVCAAGLDGATADDVAKEVAIYRAHKAVPIVIASEGDRRFAAAVDVVPVPAVHPELDFLLAAMAGHLFGYEAALAIDAQARGLRRARAAIEEVLATQASDVEMLDRLAPRLREVASPFFEELRDGRYDGHLDASTAVRLASLLRVATGAVPLDLYEVEHGRPGSPATVVEDLTVVLADAIDQLTRPVDAIKHQAKTVTVGISRSEDAFLSAPLVQAVLAAGAAATRLTYRTLRTLAALDPALAEVTGFTRYRVDGDIAAGQAVVHVLDKGGVAAGIRSRTEDDPRLRGTKHRAATTREVTVAIGGDGRSVVHVPEIDDGRVVGLTLLHARFRDLLAADEARGVLTGYQGRYGALVDAVTETEPAFRDSLLAETPILELLVTPVQDMARRWRATP